MELGEVLAEMLRGREMRFLARLPIPLRHKILAAWSMRPPAEGE